MSLVEALSLIKETKRVRETEGDAPKDHAEEVARMIKEMDGTDDD